MLMRISPDLVCQLIQIKLICCLENQTATPGAPDAKPDQKTHLDFSIEHCPF